MLNLRDTDIEAFPKNAFVQCIKGFTTTELNQESHIIAHGISTLPQHCARELQVKHLWWTIPTWSKKTTLLLSYYKNISKNNIMGSMTTSTCLLAPQNVRRLLQHSHLNQTRLLVVQFVLHRQSRDGVHTKSCVTQDLNPPNYTVGKALIFLS